MQDSTKEEQMKVAGSSGSSVDRGPREVEEEEKTPEPEIVESDEGIKAIRVSVIVYPKKTKRNINDKRMGENKSSSSSRDERHEDPASSFFSPNQQEKLIEIKDDMDEPLDLSMNSASSTKANVFSSDKHHVAEKEEMRVLYEKSRLTFVEEFSSPEENSRWKSEKECKKPFHIHKLNEIKETLESQDRITDEHVNFKRKRSDELSTNSEAKIRRCSNSASIRNSEDKSRLPADYDCSEAASADYFSCRPSLSTSASCSYASRAIEKTSTSHNPLSRFICEQCGSCFRTKYKLKRHSRTHTGEKTAKCMHCEKRFASKDYLEEHIIRLHTKKRSYRCNGCEKSFASKVDLKRHNRSHTGEKPFPCNVCKKSFTTKGHLTEHSRSHTGERPFPCNACEKSFASKGNLTRHNRSHIGEKPYVCKTCGKSYDRIQTLNSHKKTHKDKSKDT